MVGRKPLVLVADDDAVTRRLLEHHLAAAGYLATQAVDGADAIERLSADVAVAIVDLQMPRAGGMDFLRAALARFPELPVLVISQFGEVKDAVRAMKEGAFEYITKPIDPEELLVQVEHALRSGRLARENSQLRQAVASPMPTVRVIGESAAAQRLREQIEKVAGLDATVLLTGESGTGKTTLARMIHQLGKRRGHPFVAVSCASLPRDLIEAELFGHKKGAFTGALADRPGRAEMADGGTLFLDEIGDLPLELQPKLLTFLHDRVVQRIGDAESRTVDVRVIAATNHDLKQRCREGRFRDDLYYRLNVLPIESPPLRQRGQDMLAFANEALARIAAARSSAPLSLSAGAKEAILCYSWPGNIRELENVLERATAFAAGAALTPEDLGISPGQAASAPVAPSLAGLTLEEIERRAIRDHLHASGGNKKAAAKALGIDEKSIYNKMKRLGLTDDG